MKRQFECQYCGKLFWCPMRKAWAIWLCNVHHFKSESGEDVEVHDRIKLIGTVFSSIEAKNYILKSMEKDQCIENEKMLLNKEKFCPQCKRMAKIYNDRLQARLKREQKQRAIESGDKTGKIAEIKDKDMKGFMKYLVDKKIDEQQREKLDAERKQMEKRGKVFIPQSITNVNTEESKNDIPNSQ